MLETLYGFIGGDSGPILWWQMIVRSLIVFAYGLLLVRLGARRMFGRKTAFDILLAVILGSVLSRALTGNAPFFPTLAAATALVALHWLLALMSFHWKSVGVLTKGGNRQLVENGEIVWREMRAGKVGEEDLLESIRLRGVDSVTAVQKAFLERGGDISVIRRRPS